MARQPSFQFYPADWLKDPAVQAAKSATRGAWINLLCRMWEASSQGKLIGTEDEIRRLAGVEIAEWPDILREIKTLKIGEVTQRNDLLTLINRRMYKQAKIREQNRLRKRKFDMERKSNALVTPYSSSSSSDTELSKDNSVPLPPTEGGPKEHLMELFNSLCRTAPKIKKLDGNRLKKTLKMLREYPNLDEWRTVFETVEASDFLTGRREGRNGPFVATFDWIIKPDNLLKIIEGNYKNMGGNGICPASAKTSRPASSEEFQRHIDERGADVF